MEKSRLISAMESGTELLKAGLNSIFTAVMPGEIFRVKK
jgi:hypothetical protein